MKDKKYFFHETAILDEDCVIGENTKIWHFSHLMANCVVGENCNIGQNVVILAKAEGLDAHAMSVELRLNNK